MDKKSYKVGIVLDPNFGNKLVNLLKRMHVWYIDSENNRRTIENHIDELKKVWSETDLNDPFDLGMSIIPTNYKNDEENFIELIEEVDDHHGVHHHSPPWEKIEVYGVKMTPKIRSFFNYLGAKDIRETKDGFVCSR